ncbi:iron-containing alcohol dehydrogenase [Carboxylicivirga sp. M1479]|uniref:iron-containing alcohol dehydrogenase n=1 Tax=Carboxylicivirga sp. M1479 TaxID=2594476 RepID=UPI00117742F0|nr:iron-containing alcohol dehydrogenase [Carboxylicivirga sp. M1479]TRX65885.1 iron-containing alcohol dehydrogenase [Carboxylicivirga sp. M1479]
MKNFTYLASTKVLFGKNRVAEIGKEILPYGKKVLLAYGGGSIKKNGLYAKLIEVLGASGIEVVELSGIQPNPRIESVREGIRLCRENDVQFILGVGGGSVIDCIKAISMGVHYQGDAWDFFIRKAKIEKVLPIGSVLTLAATGSEMNGNTVISNESTQEKRASGHDSLRPQFSILDPTYTFTVNKWQTAAGVVDVMSHIFEQYFTLDKGTFVQDAMAEGILKTCIHYGSILLNEPDNYEARANLMWASSLALNGLTGTGKLAGDWSTHNIEHEVSAIYDLTHGAGLAILFPVWMNYVLDEKTAPKLAQYSRNVWGVSNPDDIEAAKEGIEKTRSFFSSLNMPATLADVDIDGSKVDAMAEGACKYGAIGMFKKLDIDAVKEILIKSL